MLNSLLSRVLVPCLLLSVFPIAPAARTLLVLPVGGEVMSSGGDDLSAVNRLFRDALEARHGKVLSPVSASPCSDRACALAAAAEAKLEKSDEVVYASLDRLGTKLIFMGSIVRADGKKAYNERMTVTNIEDLESVTQRMAEVLLSRTAPEFAASVDDITEREKTFERTKRKTPYAVGLGVGYLIPVNNGFQYREEDNNNPNSGYSLTDNAALLRVSWVHNWEFRRDIHFGLEGSWTQTNAFGGDLNLSYLYGSGDFSPFLGAGLGLHTVRGDDDPLTKNRRNFGPAGNINVGVYMFRTYGMNVRLRGQYLTVLTDDRDQGVVVDVAVIFQ